MARELNNRFAAMRDQPPHEPPIRIEIGTMDDYRALAHHHYRSRFPGAVTGIVRAVIDEPSLAWRFSGKKAQRTTETRRHRDSERREARSRISTDDEVGMMGDERARRHSARLDLTVQATAPAGENAIEATPDQSSPLTSPSPVSPRPSGSRPLSDAQVIGVLVISLPSPACRLRDLATADRYRNLGPREGTALLNREVRCISRVIVDPRFRGTGVAEQLVRHALDHVAPGVRFTEALAAMGRVNPFFVRAGMTRYERPLREDESRLIDALSCVSLEPTGLASVSHAIDVIETQPRHRQAWIDVELRRWRRASARLPLARMRGLTLRDLLIAARDKLLLQPVYFIAAHQGTPKQKTEYHRGTETQRTA